MENKDFDRAVSLYEEKQYDKAFALFESLVNQGYAPAFENLGNCYNYGYGVAKDKQKAIELWHKAADQGIALSQLSLAYVYFKGEDAIQDYTKAVHWFLKAAEQGMNIAQKMVGKCYENGFGVEKDYTKAALWYRKSGLFGTNEEEVKKLEEKAAVINDSKSISDSDIERKYQEAEDFYSKGVELDGDGNYEEADEEFEKAAVIYKALAELNHIESMDMIAYCYENGKGINEDKIKAEELYAKVKELKGLKKK